jgi:hypothetical protein
MIHEHVFPIIPISLSPNIDESLGEWHRLWSERQRAIEAFHLFYGPESLQLFGCEK